MNKDTVTRIGRAPIKRALISVYDKTGLEELAAGLHAAKAHALESGREKSLGRDALARLAEVFGCGADDLAGRGRKAGRP